MSDDIDDFHTIIMVYHEEGTVSFHFFGEGQNRKNKKSSLFRRKSFLATGKSGHQEVIKNRGFSPHSLETREFRKKYDEDEYNDGMLIGLSYYAFSGIKWYTTFSNGFFYYFILTRFIDTVILSTGRSLPESLKKADRQVHNERSSFIRLILPLKKATDIFVTSFKSCL